MYPTVPTACGRMVLAMGSIPPSPLLLIPRRSNTGSIPIFSYIPTLGLATSDSSS